MEVDGDAAFTDCFKSHMFMATLSKTATCSLWMYYLCSETFFILHNFFNDKLQTATEGDS